MNLADKVFNHLFCDFEISDNTIAQRTDRGNRPGRTTKHLLCLGPHGQNFLAPQQAIFSHSHHRRLIQNDSATLYINKCVCRTQIYRHIGRKELHQPVIHICPQNK